MSCLYNCLIVKSQLAQMTCTHTHTQGSELRVSVLCPPKKFYGGKITGTNDVADSPEESYGPGGLTTICPADRPCPLIFAKDLK